MTGNVDIILVGIKPELRDDFIQRLARLIAEGKRSNFVVRSMDVAMYWRERGINGLPLPLPDQILGVKLLEF